MPEFTGIGFSIIDSAANAGKYSIIKPDKSLIKDDLDEVQACSLILMARYRAILETSTKKTFHMPQDFFHEVESNREYHARELLALHLLDDGEMFISKVKPHIYGFTVGNLEALDKILFHENKISKLTTYEKPWLVVSLMVHFANWEIKTFESRLFKEDYIAAIAAPNMPSHIRLLSRVVENKKELVLENYPSSLLMNYSNFYPTDLYHTGTPPE